MNNPTEITWAKLGLHALFAVMGGLVRELSQEGTHSFVKFVAGGFIGMFCGTVVYYCAKEYGVGVNLPVAFVGLAGYIGTPTLDLLAKQLRKLNHQNQPPSDPPADEKKP